MPNELNCALFPQTKKTPVLTVSMSTISDLEVKYIHVCTSSTMILTCRGL